MKAIVPVSALMILLLVVMTSGDGKREEIVKPTSFSDVGSTTETVDRQPPLLTAARVPEGLGAIEKIKANVGSSATQEHVQALTRMGIRAIPVIMSEVRTSTERRWHHYAITSIRKPSSSFIRRRISRLRGVGTQKGAGKAVLIR